MKYTEDGKHAIVTIVLRFRDGDVDRLQNYKFNLDPGNNYLLSPTARMDIHGKSFTFQKTTKSGKMIYLEDEENINSKEIQNNPNNRSYWMNVPLNETIQAVISHFNALQKENAELKQLIENLQKDKTHV